MGPPSRPTPGRKIRPVLPHSNRPAEARQSTAPAGPARAAPGAHRASRPGVALCRLGPAALPAMCRLQAVRPKSPAHRILRQRRDSPARLHPSSPTVPVPVRQEPPFQRVGRSTPPNPIPVPQERRPGIPRRSSQTLPGSVPQEARPRAGLPGSPIMSRRRGQLAKAAQQERRAVLPKQTISSPVRQEVPPRVRRPNSRRAFSPVRQEREHTLSPPAPRIWPRRL